jgi:RNA polymerase sigma factor (sigma-70 family)
MTSSNSTITFWLNNAAKYPLLPKNEVLRIAKIIQDPSTPDTKRERMVQKLVRHNLKLVPGMVRAFMRKKKTYKYGDENTLDFLQQGALGLKRAAEKFDPSRGYAFSTYALPWIRQAIQRESYQILSPIRVPENTVSECYRTLRNGTLSELAPSKVHRLVDGLNAINYRSLDLMLNDKENGVALMETIAAPRNGSDKTGISFEDILDRACISKEQAKLLTNYYKNEMSQAEIAKALGVSRQVVGNRIHTAIKKIKKNFRYTEV